MTTGTDLITLALKDIGALGIGQSISAEDTADALATLNMMLGQWAAERLSVYHLIDTAHQANGSVSYTVYRQIVKDASGVTIWDQVTEDSNAGLTGNITDAKFVAGVDFTPGTTVSLTLPVAPGASTNMWTFFDAAYQADDQILSLVGTALTFVSPIPIGVQEVNIKIGTTIAVGTPGSGTVTDATVASGANIDSSKLSFLQEGSGAVARTVRSKLRDWLSVADFGAIQTATDNATAFQLAANACNALGGGTVFVPAGTWKIASTITTYPNVEFVGAGQFATFIVPTTSNMTLFSLVNSVVTQTYVAFRNLSIAPTASGVTGIALTLCNFTAIENIDFIGCVQNFVIDRGYFHTITKIVSNGVPGLPAGSATLTSTVDTDYVFHANISDYKLVNNSSGTNSTGLYMRRAIDFEVDNVQAFGATTCTVLLIENDSQGVKIKGLNVAGIAAGITLQQGAGVAVFPSFTSVSASGIDQPTAFGMHINGATYTTLTDVMFTPSASFTNIPALFMENDLNTIVNGCQFFGWSSSPSGTGIQLSASKNAIVHNNAFDQCHIGVGYANTPTGISLKDNQFTNTPNPIAGSFTGSNNRIGPSQNGLSPSSFVTPVPTFPASGTPFTNTTAFSCRVFISGGAFTAISLAGVSMTAIGSWFGEVQPGESITITYTSLPAWSWVGK